MSGGDGTPGFPQPETVFSDIKTTIPFRTGQWNAIVEFGLILVCPKKLLVIKTYSTLVRPVDVNLISPEFNDMHMIKRSLCLIGKRYIERREWA